MEAHRSKVILPHSHNKYKPPVLSEIHESDWLSQFLFADRKQSRLRSS